MQWVLLSMFGLALVAFAISLLKLVDSEKNHSTVERADHAKCIAHIASVTSNAFVATRLRDLAEKWDSIEGQADLTRLRNIAYREGGVSIVSLWLQEQADKIEQS